MQYITLVASEVVNKVKVKVGESPDFPIAEKLDDFQELIDSKTATAEEIVSCFNYGWRVKGQTEIKRNNKKPEANENVKLFKSLTAEQQIDMLQKYGLTK